MNRLPLDGWVRVHPDVHVQVIAAEIGKFCEYHSSAIELAVRADADQLPRLTAPDSALLVRH